MKVIFLGTPDFAAVCLKELIKSRHEVLAVVCQPDKPVGRGNNFEFPPTKKIAIENNIPVYQFTKISKEGHILKALNADIMITCAFGQILSEDNIALTPNGIINVHGSLLPKYRGPAPIQWAIINGEKETGITIMKTVKALDAGDVLTQTKIEINPDMTAGELFEKMAELGGKCLLEALDLIEGKNAKYTPQVENEATYYPMLKKEMAKLDFNKSGKELKDMVRGLNPWPVSFFEYNNERIKVYELKHIDGEFSGQIGEVLESSSKQGLKIRCNGGLVEILDMQAPSSKRMSAKNYLNGKTIKIGTILG